MCLQTKPDDWSAKLNAAQENQSQENIIETVPIIRTDKLPFKITSSEKVNTETSSRNDWKITDKGISSSVCFKMINSQSNKSWERQLPDRQFLQRCRHSLSTKSTNIISFYRFSYMKSDGEDGQVNMKHWLFRTVIGRKTKRRNMQSFFNKIVCSHFCAAFTSCHITTAYNNHPYRGDILISLSFAAWNLC